MRIKKNGTELMKFIGNTSEGREKKKKMTKRLKIRKIFPMKFWKCYFCPIQNKRKLKVEWNVKKKKKQWNPLQIWQHLKWLCYEDHILWYTSFIGIDRIMPMFEHREFNLKYTCTEVPLWIQKQYYDNKLFLNWGSPTFMPQNRISIRLYAIIKEK